MQIETILLIVFSILASISAIFFMAIRVTKAPIYGLLTKTLASMVFVAMGACALTVGQSTLPFGSALFVLGLAFGMVGDIILDLKRAHSEFEDIYLFCGMSAFSLGHFAYIAALCLIASPMILASKPLLVPALIALGVAVVVAPLTFVITVKFMGARYGKFTALALFYAALLIFITVLSIIIASSVPKFILLAVGMTLFLISDLVLSTMYFVEGKKEDKLLVIINHTTYYAAQICIAAFLYTII